MKSTLAGRLQQRVQSHAALPVMSTTISSQAVKPGSAHHGPGAKYGPQPVSINKVLLAHSMPFIYRLSLADLCQGSKGA